MTISKRVIDLTDQIFSKLIVVDYAGRDKWNKANWNCLCECGNMIKVEGYLLRAGRKTHCGCQPRTNVKNLTDKKFGRLTPLRRKTGFPDGKSRWQCQCDCGKFTDVLTHCLISGGTRSCGCLKKKSVQKNFYGK